MERNRRRRRAVGYARIYRTTGHSREQSKPLTVASSWELRCSRFPRPHIRFNRRRWPGLREPRRAPRHHFERRKTGGCVRVAGPPTTNSLFCLPGGGRKPHPAAELVDGRGQAVVVGEEHGAGALAGWQGMSIPHRRYGRAGASQWSPAGSRSTCRGSGCISNLCDGRLARPTRSVTAGHARGEQGRTRR